MAAFAIIFVVGKMPEAMGATADGVGGNGFGSVLLINWGNFVVSQPSVEWFVCIPKT